MCDALGNRATANQLTLTGLTWELCFQVIPCLGVIDLFVAVQEMAG